jgi:uncharacterized protein YdcH (DUF465 family)
VALYQASHPSKNLGGAMMIKEEEIKEHLMSEDPEFRRLFDEHHQYESKLQELTKQHHMTEQDHLEEIRLKKRKLHLKDQMNALIQKARNEPSPQHT